MNYPWTLSEGINEAHSDEWVKYRTLYFCGLVRGQLLQEVAEAIVAQLNLAHVDGGR